MSTLIKYPQRQDCHFKLSAGNSGETSINLSTEIALFLNDGKTLSQGEEIPVSFILYKEDFIKAVCHIVDNLPLFKTSSTSSTKIEFSNNFFLENIAAISNFFGNGESASYNVTLSAVSAPRYYLKNLNNNGFNLRKFLTENNSTLYFSKADNSFVIRLTSGEVKPDDKELDLNDDFSLVVKNKVLKKFVLEALIYLQKHETLDSLSAYASSGPSVKISSVEHSFTLTGMFLESSLDDVRMRNTPRVRWFEEPLFHIKKQQVYLSDQWYGEGNFQLTLVDFKKMIKVCFNNKYVVKTDSEGIFELWRVGNISSFTPNQPLQQIFYGAPGTGKSHTIKKTTENVDSKFVVRTTFHPDSDYSTFVGAYKPKMEVMPRFNPNTGEQIGVEKRIVYAYTPQAFLKAYTTAWQNPEQAVYLIIEEINRGNCAQIFGDLFQLLDRGDNGQSCYPIKADQDMQMYLMETFADDESLPENIRSGEELVLPANLYIWATMNTSDQSLFPIDSAFKRRWEWKYIPITQGKDKESGKLMQWSIESEDVSYDWWSFLEVMNKRVGDITSSEDKKLGFFFCKADGAGIISADKFVSKVIFYLWNDVFKDYPDNPIAANLKEEDAEFTYGDFYTIDNSGEVVVREELVTKLLEALGVKVVAINDEDSEDSSLDDNADRTGVFTKRHIKVVYPDGMIIEHNNSTTTLLKVIDIAGPERVAGLNLYISEYPLVSKGKIPQDGKGYADSQRPISNDYWVVTKFDTDYKKRKLVEISDKLGLGLQVSIVEKN